MANGSRLIPVSYFNLTHELRLNAYADVIVYEQDGKQNTLRAIRFGGYPEMVQALSDALYAGAALDAEIGQDTLHLLSQTKRYQRTISHDGIYAEAVLLALDDEQQSGVKASKENEQDEMNFPPRKCLIFCPKDDRKRLFEEVDRKTSVPLIPEFQDYVLDELQRRDILQKLTVISIREELDAWVLRCTNQDENIVSVVEDGLKSGAIRIPGTVKDPKGFDSVTSVVSYLNAFGVTVAERIRGQFKPLFDPAREPLSEEILEINEYIRSHAGYPLYDAQLAVAEAVKRRLKKHKSAIIVAECGSGKTKIGATAMAAIQAAQAKDGERRTFNVVLCPSHVAKKWVREIAETLPNTVGAVVKSNKELDKLYALYEKGDKSVYAVISKERARDGYMKRPAVLWNRYANAFLCPHCMEPIRTPVIEDGSHYMANANQLFFRRENRKNHKCDACGTVLWAPVIPGQKCDWAKISGYGWVYKPLASEHFSRTTDVQVLDRLHEFDEDPDAYTPVMGAMRRYPISSYIRHMYKGRIDGCIVDELHEYNNKSGQGDAMAEIYSVSKRVIGMTATLINGYSSGIFHLLYRVAPDLMMKDGKRYSSPSDFDREYGVVETTYFAEETEYNSNRRTAKRRMQTRQLPGVSPLVYSRFLLEQAVFLSLVDMGKDLPDYEEIPVPLDMEEPVKREYKRIENILQKVMRSDRKMARKILSAYLNLLTVYPDQFYDQPEIVHPESGLAIVKPLDMGSFEDIGPKEQAVLDIVRRKVQAGERVIVYTSWTRTDSQAKLKKLLTEAGYRTEIMTGNVETEAREEWVRKRLSKGMQVLITNPSLVETGLDLNAFTTLIFYSLGYKLFTLRQASRRSWRINQTAPRVEVYLLYYKHTMQHKAIKLMASKLAVAGIIEGCFTEEGLAAMSDVQDMTSQMAKELMLGIRDSVEDVAASFKKMAIINPNRNTAPIVQEQPPVIQSMERATVQIPVMRMFDPQKTAELAAIVEKEFSRKRRKKVEVDENQLSIFDQVA